jgi:hypothetical protein
MVRQLSNPPCPKLSRGELEKKFVAPLLE